jgi:hypothetical protein
VFFLCVRGETITTAHEKVTYSTGLISFGKMQNAGNVAEQHSKPVVYFNNWFGFNFAAKY